MFFLFKSDQVFAMLKSVEDNDQITKCNLMMSKYYLWCKKKQLALVGIK